MIIPMTTSKKVRTSAMARPMRTMAQRARCLSDFKKNELGFSTKIEDKLPGSVSPSWPLVASRKGVSVVPLKSTAEAVPNVVILM